MTTTESSHNQKQTQNFFDDTVREQVRADIRAVLSDEAQSISNLIAHIPPSAIELVEQIVACRGRVVFSGMGKSGLIGRKLVATFASTGTPSLFLHPGEALHGDLGMVQPDDIFIALSKSASGVELQQLIPALKSNGNKVVLLCCQNTGPLISLAHLVVVLPFEREACAHDLAPTSSSTLMLAFGDGVAMAVSKFNRFSKQDFAKFHPGGALGKRLLLKVSSLMHTREALPIIAHDASFQEVLYTITSKKLGSGIIVDEKHNLKGLITDGDLRRACERGKEIFDASAVDFMTVGPKTIGEKSSAYHALEVMERYSITSLVVVSGTKVVGLIHIHDILQAGIKK